MTEDNSNLRSSMADGELEDSLAGFDGPEIALPIGAVIADRYEVLKQLGHGTSGVVYKVCDRLLGNLTVALKVIPTEVVDDPVAVTRLYRELLASFDFDHENIARFYDCIRGDNYIGLVIEFVEGGTLEDVFQQGKRFVAEEVRSIMVQVCKGLELVHNAGIVHRDLKPENILFTDSGIVKITDFGLARGMELGDDSGSEEERLALFQGDAIAKRATAVGGVAGSPLFLAPEYIASGKVSPLNDIYALGVIGYQLLSGLEPFPQDSLVEMLKVKMREEPPGIVTVYPNANAELSAIIEKAMSIKPHRRYQSAFELRRALERLNLGNLSQAYSASLFHDQVEPENDAIVDTLYNVYSFPVRMLSKTGIFNLGLPWYVKYFMAISIFILVFLATAPLVGLETGAMDEMLPESVFSALQGVRSFLKPPA